MNAVLTTNDVAKLLRLTPLTVRNLANRGDIPGRKVGAQWRFRREEIEALIGKQQPQNAV